MTLNPISDIAPVLSTKSLDIQATIERRFTLKYLHDMIRIYSKLLLFDQCINHLKFYFKVMGLSLCCRLNWLLTFSLETKLHPRKLERWFVLWSFSRGCSLFLKIYHMVLHGILLCLGWCSKLLICLISCINWYVGLLVLR